MTEKRERNMGKRFSCPHCHAEIVLEASYVGLTIACPKCMSIAEIPDEVLNAARRNGPNWFARCIGASVLFVVVFFFAESAGLKRGVGFGLGVAIGGAFLWKGGSLLEWLLNVLTHQGV